MNTPKSGGERRNRFNLSTRGGLTPKNQKNGAIGLSYPQSANLTNLRYPSSGKKYGLHNKSIGGSLTPNPKNKNKSDKNNKSAGRYNRFDLTYRVAGGVKVDWDKHGGRNGGMTPTLTRTPGRKGPKNDDNQSKAKQNIENQSSPVKKVRSKSKSKTPKSSSSSSSSSPVTVKQTPRNLSIKNYTLLDREDWSKIGRGSKIIYEKKLDGKKVSAFVLSPLFAKKTDITDENEYMFLELGKLKWSVKYNSIQNVWLHPGMGRLLESEHDSRIKFEQTVKSNREKAKKYVYGDEGDSKALSDEVTKVKNNVCELKDSIINNKDNLNDLLQQNMKLKSKISDMEEDIENITKFLTRKFQTQFVGQPQQMLQPQQYSQIL